MTDGFLIASQLLLWLCVVAMGILLYTFFQVLRRYESERQAGAENSREGMGLQTGQAAPSFSAQAVGGERISNSTLSGAQNALLFISPLCPTCVATATEVETLSYKTSGNIVFICEGSNSECRALLKELDGAYPFVIDESRTLGHTFGIIKTPTAVLLDDQGVIEKYGNPMRKEDLEEIAPEMFVDGVRPTFMDEAAHA